MSAMILMPEVRSISISVSNTSKLCFTHHNVDGTVQRGARATASHVEAGLMWNLKKEIVSCHVQIIPRLIACLPGGNITEMLHSWWLAESHLDRLLAQYNIKAKVTRQLCV